MQKITPNLWFNRNAIEAVDFYLSAFKDAKIVSQIDYPRKGLVDFQKKFAGQPVAIEFELMGYRLSALNAGSEFIPNPSISFMINFDPAHDTDAEKHINELWEILSKEGKVRMPFQTYDFSKLYGWIEDKYNVSWQLILTDPQGDPRPNIMPALLFVTDECEAAEAAADFYLSVFKNTQRGQIVRYPGGMGANKKGTVMFSDFTLEGQWFVAMDSSSKDHAFKFNEAVSLSIACKDQREIDYYYDKLSHVPESEVCGWCKDKYGVSWQVVPENSAALLQKPNAWQNMMKMKKIIIADY
jgi:predicted 3-demethylubiquinone-9 3-methyltransferase (glyoxalase superfamily)